MSTPNVLVTPTILTKMTLMNLGNYLNVAKNMSKDYSREFGNKAQKIGNVLYVRKPQRWQVTEGLQFQPQPITNTQTPVTVDKVRGVHFEWDSVEKTLSLTEVNELYAKPAAIALASKINQEAAQFIARNTFNATGTPGTVPNSLSTYLTGGDILVELGLPENEDVTAIISRRMSSTYVNAVSTVFNPAGVIGGQYKEGMVAPSALGYNWKLDQTLYRHTYGTYAGTPVVDVAGQTADGGNNGTMTLTTSGWSSGASSLKAGDQFTIGSLTDGTGVQSVHPQTKQPTGRLQGFVVLADISDTSGAMSIQIAPAITPSSIGPNGNQYANVNQAPAANATINVSGVTGTVSEQGLLMHRNAYAFLSVPLSNPEPGMGAICAQETDPDTGMTLAFIKAFDAVHRVEVTRFDCLFGFGSLYKEMACRIQS